MACSRGLASTFWRYFEDFEGFDVGCWLLEVLRCKVVQGDAR